MRDKDYCNCEHTVTLRQFIEEALKAITFCDYKEARVLLEFGLKVHAKAQEEYLNEIA